MREVIVPDDVAERFERDLETSMADLKEAVAVIDREAMERALQTLTDALRHDLVDASDFER
jgi:DNA-binding MurR/RpiR family transcriptional regulator